MSKRLITLGELQNHSSKGDCWVLIHGTVYNLTNFLGEHPGGEQEILNWAGKDATAEFDKFHSKSFLSSFLTPDVIVGVGEPTAPPPKPQPQPQPEPQPQPQPQPQHQQQQQIQPWTKPPLSSMLNIFDFESVAARVMDHDGWSYYSSGGDDEITLRDNHAAFQRIWFRPRVLVNVKEISMRSTILGNASSFPVYVTATALAKLAHPEGEVVLTRAAHSEGIIQMCPTLASCTMEEMVEARKPGQVQFFQLYVNSNRKVTENIVRKAESLGFKALCITVDAPQLGRREKDMRNKFQTAAPTLQKGQSVDRSQGTARAISSFIDPSLSWKDIPWLRSITKMPLVLKGIQCAEDALLAVQYGVDAIILTNHGGRQLDYSRSGIEILPEVMNALRSIGAENALEVWIDGGIRRGTDVFKALALGAKAVGIGRPTLYALASYGQEGVEKAIQLLKSELEMAMRLMGAPKISDIKPNMVITKNLDTHITFTRDHLSDGSYMPLQPAVPVSKL